MSRLPVVLFWALAALALLQASALALRAPASPRAPLPLMGADAPPGALQGPGEAERTLRAQAVAIGDFLTIEDLARGVLLLERGELADAPPLSGAERDEVARLLAQADAHRTELLQIEGEIAAVDAELAEVAARLAASLTPAQRQWVVARRDQVSVGEVERAYWDAVLDALKEPE
ncbi:MAG: hypothetical protein H6739_21955 [Alphaproteobacteria bacterium]|nr:hypothetical protein [Alphaproteobacteria bacterium]